MKKLFCIFIVLVSCDAYPHSQEECARYVNDMVAAIQISPEWGDCLDEADTNDIEVLYPTMESVFVDALSSNSVAFLWTAAERQQALGEYLDVMSTTNVALASQEYCRTGMYALLSCLQKGYTNVLPQARSILSSANAPCKDVALSYVLGVSPASDEKTAIVLGVQSNRTDFTVHEGQRAFSEYVTELRAARQTDVATFNNAVRLFYRNRAIVVHPTALDTLLMNAYSDYSGSSNRLDLAVMALDQLPVDSDDAINGRVRAYFVPVTNQLMNATQPLPEIEALRGL